MGRLLDGIDQPHAVPAALHQEGGAQCAVRVGEAVDALHVEPKRVVAHSSAALAIYVDLDLAHT